jgi:hypothetical protein
LWTPDLCPFVAILEPVPQGFAGPALADLIAGRRLLADRTFASGRHLVFGDGAALHRIWLRCPEPGLPLAALIPCDAYGELRWRASSAVIERNGAATPAGGGVAMPTAFQAWRLNLLLAILDAGDGSGPVSSHEVARQVVYPHLAIGRGAEWKTAPERRRTQRLIKEAHAMMAGGYRALLCGRAGRQK